MNRSRWTESALGYLRESMYQEKHAEMKHLVFKSVLGARQNEEPLIKARHVISTHVTQSRPRPSASPSPHAAEKRFFKTFCTQTPGAGFIHKAPSLGSARSGCQKCLNMEKNKQLQHFFFWRDLSEALCDVMGNAAFVLPAGK